MTETITAAEYQASAKQRKPSKYKNVPAIGADGKRKASKSEALRDGELALLARAGRIQGLKRQPRFPLYVNGKLVTTYVGDWEYLELDREGWHRIVEDRKGAITKEFRIKWALAKALHPEIEWRLS